MLLRKVFPVPPFYQLLVYAGILHSCSYVAHIKVAEAQCCWQCPQSGLLWTTMFSGVTDSLYTMTIQYTLCCYCPLSALFMFFNLMGFAKSYKMTFWRQENPGKWLWLDKVISEIPKPLKMVLCSYHDTVSFKKKIKNLPGFQYFTADRMSLVSPPSSNGLTIPLK